MPRRPLQPRPRPRRELPCQLGKRVQEMDGHGVAYVRETGQRNYTVMRVIWAD
ncbi:hypothetical protein ONA70_34385 [Micromonospora yasonensis]|uniref:hypothetical protein n=1 Tax=Micromonospora yasonensis TaxID=1128667 RepID=UPI0022323B82|nr:hypothetical protein [Micromonospora yasonensis]MCW3845168.1 hypothetical protein [Micromonospora yasonensis]